MILNKLSSDVITSGTKTKYVVPRCCFLLQPFPPHQISNYIKAFHPAPGRPPLAPVTMPRATEARKISVGEIRYVGVLWVHAMWPAVARALRCSQCSAVAGNCTQLPQSHECRCPVAQVASAPRLCCSCAHASAHPLAVTRILSFPLVPTTALRPAQWCAALHFAVRAFIVLVASHARPLRSTMI